MASAIATTSRKPTAAEVIRTQVLIEDRAAVPGWVQDLDSYRAWVKSDEFPQSGEFAFLDGTVWVDLTMEQLFTHNGVRMECGGVLRNVNLELDRGYLFVDGALLSHPDANLSTEPDALFVLYESIKSGRIKLIEGADEGYVELEGSADMTLEIVSPTSARKDMEMLLDLYWRAGVTEYWLIDARQELSFRIYRRGRKKFQAVKPLDGWLRSEVFGRSFQATSEGDALGNPRFRLLVRQVS
ncbi:MAG: Uma2 family endonuclease [Planctomycetes bacterium]|nr:Uma2 family endonuclease [Planctomycetota bacterium]